MSSELMFHLSGVIDYARLVLRAGREFMVIRMKTDMNLKCHQQCLGTENPGVCAAGVFHVFSIIKKIGTKPREFCYLRLLMNALHIWVLLSDSQFVRV